ncbi:MAG TPA: serine/threonine-protein kinase [Bdellovibrionota bacterium]|nr:serine/threonine-protein kinase [Bdellovibrionota bacterium]
MGKEVLKKFGRYFLLDQIAQGGMAEIYRARFASADAAGRLIVIKRIQSGYGGNTEFLQMFKSEIKVTMGFNHPNIVQLYDFGEEMNQPYIAMEFVDGRNLRQFITRSADAKQPFPIEHAAYIIEQAACGLHYAHSFKDKITGQHLNIIHRDISPQNVLISYDGSVKVIDFGIAKATTNSEATRAGVIKGKPSYLSPEQISGDTLDARCDIFALGAVLWELLAGKKLFAGENDLAILKLIESCQTYVKPPSTQNSRVPKELDYIVLKALAKQREKRYQTAEEFQRALHRFLYTYANEFNPADLSYFAKDLFKSEIVDDRKRVQQLNDRAEQLLSFEIRESTPAIVERGYAPSQEDTATVRMRGPISTGSRDAFEEVGGGVKIESGIPGSSPFKTPGELAKMREAKRAKVPAQKRHFRSGQKWRIKNMVLTAAAALVIASVLGPEIGIRIPVISDLLEQGTAANLATLVLEGDSREVVVSVNNETVARSLPASLKRLPVDKPLRIAVKTSTETFEREITLKKGENRVLSVVFESVLSTAEKRDRLPAAAKAVLLHLNISPGGGGGTIAVNGISINPNNPVVQVPLDSALELSIERPGFRSFRREFVISSQEVGNQTDVPMDIQLDPVSFGFLTVRSTPSGEATIVVQKAAPGLDLKPWVKKTPFENERLPAGSYIIKLRNLVLGMKKDIPITVQENKIINIDTQLELEE